MKYISITEAAQKWGMSDRRIRYLCTAGRVDGAIKLGWTWTIPSDAPRPTDGRHMRKYRNTDIRPGTVDVDYLKKLQDHFHPDTSLKESKAYQKITGKRPTVTAIHAGLECGIINDRIPGMESVSIGPELRDVHSVNENLNVESAERICDFVKKLLPMLK